MKRIKTLPPKPKPGPVPTYNWDELLDGSMWEIPLSSIIGTIVTFRESLYRQATKRGLSVSTFVAENGNLIIEGVKPNGRIDMETSRKKNSKTIRNN